MRAIGKIMTLLWATILLATSVPAVGLDEDSSVCYVQSATPGCREASYGRARPIRVLTRMRAGVYLQVPKGGNAVVVFRRSGGRYRLVGPGQARIEKSALTALRGARVQNLGRLDLRLTGEARRDERYGRSTGGVSEGLELRMGLPDPPPTGPLPAAPPRSRAPLPPIPPLVRAVTPDGPVRETPTAIVLRPAPPDGPVTISSFGPDGERTLELTMKAGVIAVPPGFFNEEFTSFTVLRGDRRLGEGESRVLTRTQRGELARTERLTEARGDEASLLALALLYEDLRMPEDQDRILRRLLARHPDDVALRDAVEELRKRQADVRGG